MSNTIPSAPSSSKVNFSIAILLSVVATSPPGRKLHLPLTLYLSDLFIRLPRKTIPKEQCVKAKASGRDSGCAAFPVSADIRAVLRAH